MKLDIYVNGHRMGKTQTFILKSDNHLFLRARGVHVTSGKVPGVDLVMSPMMSYAKESGRLILKVYFGRYTLLITLQKRLPFILFHLTKEI